MSFEVFKSKIERLAKKQGISVSFREEKEHGKYYAESSCGLRITGNSISPSFTAINGTHVFRFQL